MLYRSSRAIVPLLAYLQTHCSWDMFKTSLSCMRMCVCEMCKICKVFRQEIPNIPGVMPTDLVWAWYVESTSGFSINWVFVYVAGEYPRLLNLRVNERIGGIRPVKIRPFCYGWHHKANGFVFRIVPIDHRVGNLWWLYWTLCRGDTDQGFPGLTEPSW